MRDAAAATEMAISTWLFRKRKERRDAYEQGRKTAKDLVARLEAKINEFAFNRLDEVAINLLEVFKDRLNTVYDDQALDSEVVAAAELEIFKQQITDFNDNMWSELKQHLADEFEVAEILDLPDQFGEFIADRVEEAIEPRTQMLIAGAKTLYELKLEEIASKRS